MPFNLGPWLIRPDTGDVVRNGDSCHVSPKAMEVLVCLARRQGEVVGKEQIFEEVWKDTFVSDDSLTRCIGELRRAFQEDAKEPAIIKTVAKRGYILLPQVIPANGESDLSGDLDGAGSSSVSLEQRQVENKSGVRTFRLWRRPLLIGSVVAIGLAVLCALYLERRHTKSTPGAPRTIAVLPLVNLSGDPEQEYFADGMTEQLITDLAQLRACNVISRTSVMRFKGTRQSLRDVAAQLGADTVVEGTVMRSGKRVRITAQLIDATTDKHLWARSFEQEVSDVLSLQAGVAKSIADQLNLTLSAPGARSAQRRKVVPEAYEAYLRGWYLFDRAQYLKAAAHFEDATKLDPDFALAHALLFEADSMVQFSHDEPFSARALNAMETASRLDDNLAEVHDARADVLWSSQWNWEAGQAEFRRAIELDPSSVDAALHYAYGQHQLTHWQAAEEELNRILRLDPVSPAVNLEILRLLVDTHQYKPALDQFRKVIELDPNSAGAYWEAATIYSALGKKSEATQAFLKSEALFGTSPEEQHALESAARGGFHSCVRKRIEQLHERGKHDHVSPFAFATMYARLGETEETMKYLQQAYREHAGHLIWLKARAVWDPVRHDPRFQAILEGMRFPE